MKYQTSLLGYIQEEWNCVMFYRLIPLQPLQIPKRMTTFEYENNFYNFFKSREVIKILCNFHIRLYQKQFNFNFIATYVQSINHAHYRHHLDKSHEVTQIGQICLYTKEGSMQISQNIEQNTMYNYVFTVIFSLSQGVIGFICHNESYGCDLHCSLRAESWRFDFDFTKE